LALAVWYLFTSALNWINQLDQLGTPSRTTAIRFRLLVGGADVPPCPRLRQEDLQDAKSLHDEVKDKRVDALCDEALEQRGAKVSMQAATRSTAYTHMCCNPCALVLAECPHHYAPPCAELVMCEQQQLAHFEASTQGVMMHGPHCTCMTCTTCAA
jgi:hypothetical protein